MFLRARLVLAKKEKTKAVLFKGPEHWSFVEEFSKAAIDEQMDDEVVEDLASCENNSERRKRLFGKFRKKLSAEPFALTDEMMPTVSRIEILSAV